VDCYVRTNVDIVPKRRKSRIVKPLEADCNVEQLATRKLLESYKLHPLEDYVDVTERTKTDAPFQNFNKAQRRNTELQFP
jgi:hypothetical protein